MSRSFQEQNDIENLLELLNEAIDQCAASWSPERARLILDLMSRLKDHGVDVAERTKDKKYTSQVLTVHEDAERPFDVLRDPLFSIVCDPLTGARGSVVSIYEGQAECLEYDVCWFETKATSRSPHVYLVRKSVL